MSNKLINLNQFLSHQFQQIWILASLQMFPHILFVDADFISLFLFSGFIQILIALDI